MPNVVPGKRELKKMLPKLGLGDEPFDAYEDEIVEELEKIVNAVGAFDDPGYRTAFADFRGVVMQVADDNVPRKKLKYIGDRVNAMTTALNKQLKSNPGGSRIQHGDPLNESDSVISAMSAAQIKDYFSKSLKHIADLVVKGDQARAQKNAAQLAKDLDGTMYERYSERDLMGMAMGMAEKQPAGAQDGTRVNLEMLAKVKWPAFLKLYGVSDDKRLLDEFKKLGKLLVVEGPTSGKPLAQAKTLFGIMKTAFTTGKFKTPQHMLGAVTDAMLKNGGTVKVINEGVAKKLIAS